MALTDQFAACLNLEMKSWAIEHAQSWDKIVESLIFKLSFGR
ncbi:hypothetical protein [Thermophilibacter sp.]